MIIKYARKDNDGRIIEIFEGEDIFKKFHPDFIDDLVRVGESVEVGEYWIKGKGLIGKKPSDQHIIQDGLWVKSKALQRQSQNEQEIENAFDFLSSFDIDHLHVPGNLEDVIKNIIICLTKGQVE